MDAVFALPDICPAEWIGTTGPAPGAGSLMLSSTTSSSQPTHIGLKWANGVWPRVARARVDMHEKEGAKTAGDQVGGAYHGLDSPQQNGYLSKWGNVHKEKARQHHKRQDFVSPIIMTHPIWNSGHCV